MSEVADVSFCILMIKIIKNSLQREKTQLSALMFVKPAKEKGSAV